MSFKLYFSIVIALLFSLIVKAQNQSPYYNCGQIEGDISSVKKTLTESLKSKGYMITGGYYVAANKNMYVLTFTSKDIQRVCLKVKERGIISSNLRVGLEYKKGKTELSLLNPKYMFLAYLRDAYQPHKAVLDKVNNDVKSILRNLGGQLKPFGGSIAEDELKNYHYMAMMPYFDDPVELKTFSSFDEAVATIDKNLAAKKGSVKKVYKQSYKSLGVAVYGVALHDTNKGEAHFLNIIGEKHFVAMPYEIVVVGKEVTILHGRFRFALYWPELTMGTFTKIMSTPGDVEDMLRALTE
jgi:hypothetical protein